MATKILLLSQMIAFWPVWSWYVKRMLDGADEPWGIVALITLVVLALKKGGRYAPTASVILLASVLSVVYAASYGMLPPLIKGAFAVTALALSVSSICYRRTVHIGLVGLSLLSLPLIASLQFYGGFPIRYIISLGSSHILGWFGYDVTPQGTLLYWMGEVIAVDAPCAGIKMLWTGLYLNFALATWRELDFVATWLSTSFTLFIVFIGNIIRATALFFTESGIIKAPDVAHEGIGILIFTFVALVVLAFHLLNGRRSTCEL